MFDHAKLAHWSYNKLENVPSRSPSTSRQSLCPYHVGRYQVRRGLETTTDRAGGQVEQVQAQLARL